MFSSRFAIKLQFLFFALFSECTPTPTPSPGLQCFVTQAAFASTCKTKYNGFANGGRCFFLASSGGSLISGPIDKAWSACSAQGGTLAQVHTQREMDDIVNYLKNTLKLSYQRAWFGLIKDSGLKRSSSDPAIDLTGTRWYENNTFSDPLLTAGNTWIRTRQSDDTFADGKNCYDLFSDWISVTDEDCSNPYYALCTISNQSQNFTLVPNKCMRETIIRSFDSATANDDCAWSCASFNWCRSYNYYQSTGKCELFSWFHDDTTKTTSVADCYHFAYMP